MKPIEAHLLWKSEGNTRRFARWLGIPGAHFLPRASVVQAVAAELLRQAQALASLAVQAFARWSVA